MKNVKLVLAAVAFIGGIGSAFATRPMAQRDLYQLITQGGQTSCQLISCSQTNRGAGLCGVTGTKYSNSTCTTQFTGTAFAVQNP